MYVLRPSLCSRTMLTLFTLVQAQRTSDSCSLYRSHLGAGEVQLECLKRESGEFKTLSDQVVHVALLKFQEVLSGQ